MTRRRSHLRTLAQSDIDNAIAHLRSNGGADVALAFIDALEIGITLITRSPQAGSLQFAFDLDIPELRALRLKRYPYAIFCLPADDHVDVWRVLHTRRDIPGAFAQDD